MNILENIEHTILKRLAMSDRGQSLVELALTLPLLMLVLLGVLDLGRLFLGYVTVANASREGARYGMTNSADCVSNGCANIKGQAVNEAGGLITTANVTVECASFSNPTNYGACSSPQPGDRIRVTVQYNFKFETLYLFGFANMTLSDKTIMAIVK